MDKLDDVFLIKDRETLKVVADPLRAQVMDTVTNEALTVKQVADRLGLAPGKLYYHINLLEKYGLIRIAETRQVGNLIEKTYRAAASRLDIAPALMTVSTPEGKDSLYDLVTSTLDTTREDLLRSLQARYHQIDQGAREKPRQVVINRDMRYIPDERAAAFAGRVKALLEEFGTLEAPPGTHGAMNYGLAVAFYPCFYFEEDAKNG
ncbi:MAG: helix-turn-helix transcriptional regulator [Chloroflexi bacterium]|nr:helix-turn-helix transcriptional regulator [Chloroflexota bacterium]